MATTTPPPSPVSIRAPAWGSDPRWGCRHWRGFCRFNSRSRVGSDAGFATPEQHRAGFNSRSRVGSDAQLIALAEKFAVSIRAPAWGATQVADEDGAVFGVSIRAPAWGATYAGVVDNVEWPFQFALPRGERRTLQRQPQPFGGGVNSRSRVGATCSPLISCGVTTFQFALPRGERRRLGDRPHGSVGVSIRAPAWGATGDHIGLRITANVSIRAPAWGATLHPAYFMRHDDVSIRAPAWGATPHPSRL